MTMRTDILISFLLTTVFLYSYQQSIGNQFFGGSQQSSIGAAGPNSNPQFGPQQGPLNGIPDGIPRQQTLAGAPQVKIVLDLFPFEQTVHVPQLVWSEPTSQPVYCISQPPTVKLIFTCPSCNVFNFTGSGISGVKPAGSIHPFDQFLIENTEDVSGRAGYPAIKLKSMQISGEWWDNKRLQCRAFYTGVLQSANLAPFEQPNVTTETMISVIYISKPQILDQLAHRPYFPVMPSTSFGLSTVPGRFYVTQPGSLNLRCAVRGNPQPTTFQWRSGGQIVSNGPQLQIPGQQLQGPTAFSCRVAQTMVNPSRNPLTGQSMDTTDWKISDDIVVEPLVGPVVSETNFESISRSSIRDPTTGKIPVERRSPVTLQCTAGSSSKPYVIWLYQTAPGRIFNASCENGPRIISESTIPSPKMTVNVISVTSACNLVLDAFEKSGEYWCSACSYVAENYSVCNPPTNSVPSNAVNFELSGAPIISPFYRVELTPNTEKTNLYFTYCADPMPGTNEIYFTVDDARLSLDSQMTDRGIRSSGSRQNETYPRCQNVVLMFESMIDIARINSLYMNIAQPDGRTIQQRFNIQEIVKDIGREAFHTTSVDATALGVGVAIGLVLLVAILTTAYFWYRRLCCFQNGRAAKVKTTKTKFGSKPSKPGKYTPGISTQPRPDLQQGDSPNRTNERLPPTSANGFNLNSKKTPHEGLTYSEFDLVKDSSRLVPQTNNINRQTEYVRVYPSGVKSPTNSIV